MKRLGLKIPSIILTVLSIIILIFSFPIIVELIVDFAQTNNEDSSGGIIVLLLFFFVIAFAYMIILIGIGGTSLISIILNSIDLSKTLKENGNIVFNIVMLSVNFVLYIFVTGVVLYIVC